MDDAPLKRALESLRGDAVALRPLALGHVKPWLEGQKTVLRVEFERSGNAAALAEGLTRAMDTVLDALFRLISQSFAYEDEQHNAHGVQVALIAVGGYGRGELFPYSDIDLLVLHGMQDAEYAARVTEFVTYLVWDMGVKIGHAQRSFDEALAYAARDTGIRTTLLDARFLSGNRELFARFQHQFQELVNHSPLAFVEAKLAERDRRHKRFGDSRYMLEPNVKEGKGGLRDLHTLWWLARYAYPIACLHDLVEMKLLSAAEYQAFERARRFLWKVRAHLHYLAGRAEEQLTFDFQREIAPLMGYAHPDPNRAVERFMRRYFMAVRTVGSLTRIVCALLEDTKKRKPRRAFAWLAHAMRRPFLLDGERITADGETLFVREPLHMLALFHLAQEEDLDIHPRALQWITRNLPRIDRALQRAPKANAIFLDILLSPKGAETTLRRMSEAGVLGRFIPDFGRVAGQTQFNMYHAYTVDEHTLRAIGILHAIEDGHLRAELPVASEAVARIGMRRALYVALFCHDIAKGRRGDHSELGERVACRLSRRLGLTPEETETAGWLVRYHLLFSATAFRRDLSDSKTVQDFIHLVQTPERLRLLLALTVADIRAVGPGAWNEWKAALLRDLFARAEAEMGAVPPPNAPERAARLGEELRQWLPGWSEPDIAHYLGLGAPDFWSHATAPRHATVARMLRSMRCSACPLVVETVQLAGGEASEVTICAPDQAGLFSLLSGALALAGANIASAKIFTLKDGTAVDIFQVRDVGGGPFNRPERIARMAVLLERALSGELDLAREFAHAAPSYARRKTAFAVPAQIFISNEASHVHTVIEITGQDRPGFLYRVTHAFAELGIAIATAHISTYGAQAVDVFYVKDAFGMKLGHESKLRQVREKLLESLTG